MICVICGKEAKYNEKLNVYYCEKHGFTTWIKEAPEMMDIPIKIVEEARVDGEVVLG